MITTEDRAGQARRMTVHGLNGVCVTAVVFVVLAHGIPFRSMDHAAALVIAVLIGLGVVTFVLSPLLGRGQTRGTWIVERESVTFAPVQGRTRTIPWDAVERLRAARGIVDVRDDRHQGIRLGSRVLSRAKWAVLASAAERALGDRFELPDRLIASRRWYVTSAAAYAAASVIAAYAYAATGALWPTAAVLAAALVQRAATIIRRRAAVWQRPFVGPA